MLPEMIFADASSEQDNVIIVSLLMSLALLSYSLISELDLILGDGTAFYCRYRKLTSHRSSRAGTLYEHLHH